MKDFVFVSEIDDGIKRHFLKRNFGLKIRTYEDIPSYEDISAVFDDSSLDIDTLVSLIETGCNVYTCDFQRYKMLLDDKLPINFLPHWVDEESFWRDKEKKNLFDCFCSLNGNLELKETIEKNFNAYISEKELTKEEKCSLLQASNIYCYFGGRDEIAKEILEAGACGKLVLCNRIPSNEMMDMFLEIDTQVIVYESVEDCIKNLKVYLKDEQGREEIGTNICRQIKKLHSSKKRTKEILRNNLKIT